MIDFNSQQVNNKSSLESLININLQALFDFSLDERFAFSVFRIEHKKTTNKTLNLKEMCGEQTIVNTKGNWGGKRNEYDN